MVFPKFGNFGGIFRSGVIEGVGAEFIQLAARSLIKGSLRSVLSLQTLKSWITDTAGVHARSTITSPSTGD